MRGLLRIYLPELFKGGRIVMRRGLMTLVLVSLGACEQNAVPALPDAAPLHTQPDASTAVCGNGIMEGSEQCDDGNKIDGDACSTPYVLRCGGGGKGAHAAGAAAIATKHPGACPTTCNDGDACTADTLTGTACQAQ